MASQSSSDSISREESLLHLAFLEAEVGKRLELKRVTAEEEALRDRAYALKAYLDDGVPLQLLWTLQFSRRHLENLMIRVVARVRCWRGLKNFVGLVRQIDCLSS